MTFQTEFEFTLPKGYIDDDGNLHRQGVMRLATAADEILPQKDPRVQSNPAYLTIIVLSRVVTRLVLNPVSDEWSAADGRWRRDLTANRTQSVPVWSVESCPSGANRRRNDASAQCGQTSGVERLVLGV